MANTPDTLNLQGGMTQAEENWLGVGAGDGPIDDLTFNPKDVVLGAANAVADWAHEHRGHIKGVLYPMIGVAFMRELAQVGVAHAQDGSPAGGDPISAVKDHVGPYVALGIAAGSGLLAGIGNGMRVLAQERASIEKMEQSVDQQTTQINLFAKMGPEEFAQEYAMHALQQGKQPNKEDAARYAAEQMQARPEDIQKMLTELQKTKTAILKRTASLPLVVAGEAGQALLGVTGTMTMVYYTGRGMLEDFGLYGNDILFKALLADGAVGSLLPAFAMLRDIVQVESASGGRGARTQGALRHLQAVGMAPKAEKKARPKLEVGAAPAKETAGGNGQRPKFKVKVKG